MPDPIRPPASLPRSASRWSAAFFPCCRAGGSTPPISTAAGSIPACSWRNGRRGLPGAVGVGRPGGVRGAEGLPAARRVTNLLSSLSISEDREAGKICVMGPEAGDRPEQSVPGLLGSLHEQLKRIEELIEPEEAAAKKVVRPVGPAWRRATEGEHRLPVALAVALAIGLQLVLPRHLAIRPTWLLPSLEGLLMIGLIAANPRRINRTSMTLRAASVLLIALISVANGWSSAELIRGLINGTEGNNASLLLSRGATVYVTNIIVFALWYWEWDRGGPVARAQGLRRYPDFLYPQMTQPDLAPSELAAELSRLSLRLVYECHGLQPN